MMTQHALVSGNKRVSKTTINDRKNNADAFVRRWEAALAVKKKLAAAELEEEIILQKLPEDAKHGNIQVLLHLMYVGKDSNGDEKHEPVYVNSLEEIEAFYKSNYVVPPLGFGGDSPEESRKNFKAWHESRVAEYKEKEAAINEIQREFGLIAIREKIQRLNDEYDFLLEAAFAEAPATLQGLLYLAEEVCNLQSISENVEDLCGTDEKALFSLTSALRKMIAKSAH